MSHPYLHRAEKSALSTPAPARSRSPQAPAPHPVPTGRIDQWSAPFSQSRYHFEYSVLLPSVYLPEEIKTFINHYPIHVLDVRRFTNEECFQTDVREVFGFIRRSLDKEAVKQYLKEREEQFTNIDEDAYDLIAAMTDTKQLQMVKDKYRSEEGGINMCKGLLDWVEESKIEGKSAGELTILKLITAMQLDGRTSDITRLSSEPEFLEGMKKHYHIQ